MKKYLSILLMASACFCYAEEKISVQGDLPKPKYRNTTEGKDSFFAPRLKKHLDEGDLASFYKEALSIIEQLPALKVDEYTDDIYIDRMWVLYYIANAPMFKTDFDPTSYYSFWDDDDIFVKAVTVLNIEGYAKQNILDRLHLNKKFVREQLMIWCVNIIKKFRETYDSGLEGKIETLKKTPGLVNNIEQDRILDSKFSTNARRNTTLKSKLEFCEESFVLSLVRSYPEKASEVRKFIKMAGYTDDEGADLIDRTVGRTNSTEFLYQGKYGRRHDKKTAPPGK